MDTSNYEVMFKVSSIEGKVTVIDDIFKGASAKCVIATVKEIYGKDLIEITSITNLDVS